jgi:hypothetical protein
MLILLTSNPCTKGLIFKLQYYFSLRLPAEPYHAPSHLLPTLPILKYQIHIVHICVLFITYFAVMTDTSNGGPRIAIFDSRRVLLHQSVGAAFGDRSLKHIINTLRTVQRETNEFLTKLVNEQTSQPSQNAAKNESATEDKGKKQTKIIFSRPLCCIGYKWTALVSFCHYLVCVRLLGLLAY